MAGAGRWFHCHELTSYQDLGRILPHGARRTQLAPASRSRFRSPTSRNDSSLRLTTEVSSRTRGDLSISASVNRLLHETTEGVVSQTGGRDEQESRVVDRAGTAGGTISLRRWHEADHPRRGALGDVALPGRVHPLHRRLRSPRRCRPDPALGARHPARVDPAGCRWFGPPS